MHTHSLTHTHTHSQTHSLSESFTHQSISPSLPFLSQSLTPAINQSINQSINHSSNKSVPQSINQPIIKSIDRSIIAVTEPHYNISARQTWESRCWRLVIPAPEHSLTITIDPGGAVIALCTVIKADFLPGHFTPQTILR